MTASPPTWPVKRLRFVARTRMAGTSLHLLDGAREVTFLPMESIGERGELDLSASRPVEEVQSGYSRFSDGDVVIAKITPCFENGKGALIQRTATGVGYGTTELHVLTPGPELDGRFLYYLTVRSEFRRLGEACMTGSAGQQRVPEDFVRDFRIPVPPLPRQHAIADYLDRETARIDALIAAKERVLRLLAEKRRALITRAVTRGLDPDAPLRDSGIPWLGAIPAHWAIKRLRRVGEPLIGLTFDPADTASEGRGVLVLRASNVQDQRIVLEDNIYVSMSIPDTLITRVGDILICSRSGSRALVGKSALIDGESAGLTFGTFMTLFRSPRNDYLFLVFNSPIFDYQAGTYATSTISQLTIETLKNLEVPLPPDGEQREIVAYVRAEARKFDRLIERTRTTLALLQERRSALIEDTVTGRIDAEGVA